MNEKQHEVVGEKQHEVVGNAYAVLSVRELRKLLKQATAGAHKAGYVGRGKVGRHAVVLRAPLLKFGNDPDLQFATAELQIQGGAK